MATTAHKNRKVKAYLKRIVGTNPGHYYPLYDPSILIGRNKKAQVFVGNPNVSRNHCALKKAIDGWKVVDLGGVNGTFINNRKLDKGIPTSIDYGSTIFLGPPSDAPEAYIFLKENQGPKKEECSSRTSTTPNTSTVTNNFPTNLSNMPSTSNAMQHRNIASTSSVPKHKTSDHNAECSKPPFSRITAFGNDNGFLSDSSVSSMDSLKTRIRKVSSKKKGKKRPNRVLDSSDEETANVPEDRSFTDLQRTKKRSAEPGGSNECEILEQDPYNSESLLNESMLLMDCDPYPFSQSLDEPPGNQKDEGDSFANPPNLTGTTEELQKRLEKSNLHLQEALCEKAKLQATVQDLRLREDSFAQMKDDFKRMLEEEMSCNICTEIYIKATALGCSHTFCEFCITEWKKKRNQCPICRNRIEQQTKVLAMDSFIIKMLEYLDTEYRERRREVIINREEEINKRLSSRRRGRRPLQTSTAATVGRRNQPRRVQPPPPPPPQHPPVVDDDIEEVQNGINQFIRYPNFLDIALANSYTDREVDLDEEDSEDSEDSDDDSEDEVSVGYYGGHGPCYNCGRSGHWANGCPYGYR